METTTQRIYRNSRSQQLENQLTNIVAGVLCPIKTIVSEQFFTKTMQHIFLGFRNALMDSPAFSKKWEDESFRKAIMLLNLVIETLPSNPGKNIDYEIYTTVAECLITVEDNEHDGFLIFNKCVENFYSQKDLFKTFEKYDQEQEDLDSLRLALNTIVECQKIWMTSEGWGEND